MPFDFDLLVLGAGSGGLAAAERAALYGAKVAIAEQFKPGGACVNYGCIPEKLLDYAAAFNHLNRVATSYGWGDCDRQFDWAKFVAAKERHINNLNEVHLHHLQDAGVRLFQGHASFVDAHTVIVDDNPISADKILIAVGAKPIKQDISGIEYAITWHELYHLSRQPKSVAVIGCDPIGVKIAGSLNALGTQVVHIFPEAHLLPKLDGELAEVIQQRMQHQGVQILSQTKVERIEKLGDYLHLTVNSLLEPLVVEAVLADARRVPNLDGLNLPKLGIQLTSSGAIRVDEFSRTTHINIFAIGDCTERIPVTPSAIAQGRAFADTEFGEHPRAPHLDWVPLSLAARPEAAVVGYSEAEARGKWGDSVVCYRTQFRPLLYCLTGWDEKTWVKVIVNRDDSERVLGIHMVGDGAVEIIQSLAVALRLGARKQDLDNAIGIHPSSGEELFSL
jgi:glutathione reductase (NADPH)